MLIVMMLMTPPSEMSEDALSSTVLIEEEERKGGRPRSEMRRSFYDAVYIEPNGGTSLDNVKHYACKGCKRPVKK